MPLSQKEQVMDLMVKYKFNDAYRLFVLFDIDADKEIMTMLKELSTTFGNVESLEGVEHHSISTTIFRIVKLFNGK